MHIPHLNTVAHHVTSGSHVYINYPIVWRYGRSEVPAIGCELGNDVACKVKKYYIVRMVTVCFKNNYILKRVSLVT